MTIAHGNAKTATRIEGMSENGIGTAATAAGETLTSVHLGATETEIYLTISPDVMAETVSENGIESANQSVTGGIESEQRLHPERENLHQT